MKYKKMHDTDYGKRPKASQKKKKVYNMFDSFIY